ncbi:pantoate--beta-alanine ligase [Terasakiella sp. A23]|uniref:pantoate--beta-alanine ligase n=1 Tax=Terasakiella sp. FCG-A23 TaxID=3080561 RepID=UPI0029550474|nr:pantoate--beta-alanine ligase [Terasakiella sp. A23]MDV7341143.1 pantoate--beta-alanine ligase [Terasakiella sp. A23]
MSIATVRTVADLRAQVAEWRKEGLKVGLVPTMGALHEGHLTLVKTALQTCDRVIATIFVNPKQFGPNEDLDTYPRTEKEDSEKLASVGGHLLFAPNVAEMYGEDGGITKVIVTGLGDILEGACRPGFFDGVATVVTKLLLQALPDKAFFGEKDFQQLSVIKRFVSDLNIPVEIEGVPTVRETDGLAMSSRNAYLIPEEREIAPILYRTLSEVSERFKVGGTNEALCKWASQQLLDGGFQKVDYVVIKKTDDLATDAAKGDDFRILAAAFLGKARLIDNVG